MIWRIKTYIIAYVKIQKNEDKLSSMSNLQPPNWCLKIDFQKVDQHTGGKSLIHDTTVIEKLWAGMCMFSTGEGGGFFDNIYRGKKTDITLSFCHCYTIATSLYCCVANWSELFTKRGHVLYIV